MLTRLDDDDDDKIRRRDVGGRIRGALGVRTKEEKKTKKLEGPGRRKKKEKAKWVEGS